MRISLYNFRKRKRYPLLKFHGADEVFSNPKKICSKGFRLTERFVFVARVAMNIGCVIMNIDTIAWKFVHFHWPHSESRGEPFHKETPVWGTLSNYFLFNLRSCGTSTVKASQFFNPFCCISSSGLSFVETLSNQQYFVKLL